MGLEPIAVVAILVGVGVLGSVIALVNGWLKVLQAVNQPQKVVHTTDKTPGEVVAAARAARLKLVAFSVLVVMVIWSIYAYFDLDGAMNLARKSRDMVLRLLEILIAILQALHNVLASFE
ncbi:MAG: hypothetical protein DCC55_23855 [Chloroflexi bacterium]|nr:MAG: hypothetical protein DCC55_23855 [Chloroflexota bacterium]